MASIYLTIIIPILFTIVLLTFFKNKVVWWEILILFGSCLLAIGVSVGIVTMSKCWDTEYWGNLGTKAVYYEAWDEYIHQTCYRDECSGSGENRTCISIPYDCSYVAYHSEYWTLEYGGNSLRISEAKFDELTKRWHMKPVFKDMHRDYHYNDGDSYWVTWDEVEASAEPVTTVHKYENRVQGASDVFNYPEVDETTVVKEKLFKYPNPNGYSSNPILGYTDKVASTKLEYTNGLLGPTKRVRIWVLVFKDRPIETAMLQEAYWKGGNKNEFIYCIGINGTGTVTWCHIISWTKVNTLKIEARNFVMSMEKLDLNKLADYTRENIKQSFIKRDFREFSYLKVEPSKLAIVLSILFILATNIGVSIFIVMNNVED